MPEWGEASLSCLLSMVMEFGKRLLMALLIFLVGRKLIQYIM